MENVNLNDLDYPSTLNKGSHLRIMTDFLIKKKNPVILELGVERGGSTKAFLWFLEKVNGKLYSVDIDNCSEISKSLNWKFVQSNDLDHEYILKTFPELKNYGVDLIYIDSYHENFHVLKLLNIWFKYLKKDGAIFIDDIDSFPFRSQKDTWNSIVYDLTDDAIKEFYYNNFDKVYFTKYFGENGLGKMYKLTDLYDEPNPVRKIWNYNILIKVIYPYLRKIKKLLSF